MRARVTFPILLLLCACAPAHNPAASPWVEFSLEPGWGSASIKGQISHTGRVHAQVRRFFDGRRISFEKQLRPAELGRMRQAITAHIAQIGTSARIRPGTTDSDEISITVRDGEIQRMSFDLVSPCHGALTVEHENDLWNEIMRAIRSPDYDTRPHMIDC